MRMIGAVRLMVVVLVGGVLALSSPAARADEESALRDGGPTISESQAREIAWSAGLVHIEEITRTNDRWELAGRTADDDELILDIDIRDGRILD